MTYLRFSDSIEVMQPNEEEISKEIEELTLVLCRRVFDRRRHALRGVHAKSHGILRGELIIPGGLPSHLAQGLFATPASYPSSFGSRQLRVMSNMTTVVPPTASP